MIQAKVQKMIEEWNMVSSGDRLLAGVSGGADSVCLLLLLADLQKTLDFSLEAIHVEHGIRGEESLRDQKFVQDLCKELEIPLTCVAVDVPAYRAKMGLSEEEAARKLRYEKFAGVAMEKNAKVVLAHHMEDNGETILFQMLRGSGLTGICGMRPVRVDEQGVTYLRPLLGVHREEIEKELKKRGRNFCTDSTNRELEYSRNYLRNVVLPQLVQVNDRAVGHMNEMAQQLWNIKDFLEQETDRAWKEIVKEKSSGEGCAKLVISIEQLKQFHVALQTEVLMRAVGYVAGSRKDITAGHIDNLLTLCDKQSGKEVHLPYQVIGRKDFERLVIERGDMGEALPKVFYVTEEDLKCSLEEHSVLEIALGKKGERVKIKSFFYDSSMGEIPKKAYTKWMDYDKIKKGFCIRTRQNGDYFIGDAFGHHKKLQNYFVDEKISVEKREQMWLLTRDSYVLWLVGGRISEDVKVTEQTQFITEIEYIGG